ncbi:hypothetical protein C8046_02735 [Serinibacter arcticus]|uniref:Secreted protein n=1 Tax=Serinibacter arcticus TaxID=1655435 RepID=A0A2U1ZS23_9MICO|nr:hypothetical protein [Serinibacter arcticus]PWD49776.1 hypothetical protein C8046_02735 [Serinibacter arcticus]
MTTETVLAVVVVVVLLVWLVLAKANRLDLLHQKITRTAATLDAQLLRRAAQAAELAASGRLDPASSLVLAGAADACIVSGQDLEVGVEPERPHPGRVTLTTERETVESDLSRILRQALEGHGGADGGVPLIAEIVATGRRVEMARRFYNDAVAQAVRIRGQALVRLLRLAGRAVMPRTFEMDDTPPRLAA